MYTGDGLKVLIIISSLQAGGAERQCAELLKELSNEPSIEVTLILFNNIIEYEAVKSLPINIEVLSKQDKNIVKLLSELRHKINKIHPDVIHTWLPTATLYTVIAKMLMRYKLINGMIRYGKPIKRFSKLWTYGLITFPLSSHVVANSFAGLRAHNLITNKKNCVIYNGLDMNRFKIDKNSSSIRKQLNAENKIIVVMVANYGDTKDYHLLVKVAEKLESVNNDILIMSIGEGKNYNSIKDLILSKKLRNFVQLGRRNDIEEIVATSDIGILLTNTNSGAEGLSNSMQEYMALGKPVIATNSGGNPELIKDGVNGYLVAPFSKEEVVDRIRILTESTELRKKMGDTSIQIIQKDFSSSSMAKRYIDLYGK